MISSLELDNRIRMTELVGKIMTADEAATFIRNGMTLGVSGFTRAGDVKEVPKALARRVQQSGEEIKINMWSGASLAEEVDQVLNDAGVLARRLPFQADKSLRKSINQAKVMFTDPHLGLVAEKMRDGHIPKVDIAIIEAIAITENGGIVPSTSVGNSASFAEMADQIIIELNIGQPLELEGVHDIYIPENRPNRKPIPLTQPSDRIGLPYITIDPGKIVAIVITNKHDHAHEITPPSADTIDIAKHLLTFFEQQIIEGRIPKQLPPLQSGIGNVANAVLYGLQNSNFENIEMYSEVLQDAVFDLIDAGKIKFASSCSITLSPKKLEEVLCRFDHYKPFLLLRPQEISNNTEIIRRLGLIAINTALEIDIYGNVNSTHVMGSQMMNGIGGSGDFARNSYLSVFVTTSTAKDGAISCIVPMVSHVDHNEHDVDIVVTEQGLADLRGLAPRERAVAIIEHCVHPTYKDQLRDYFNEAIKGGGHTPHVLSKAFYMHTKFMEKGSML